MYAHCIGIIRQALEAVKDWEVLGLSRPIADGVIRRIKEKDTITPFPVEKLVLL